MTARMQSSITTDDDPPKVIEERELLERQYIETASAETKAQYGQLSPEGQIETLQLWKEQENERRADERCSRPRA
jgi:hypothetical protein